MTVPAPLFGRRAILGALPALFVAAGCAKPAESNDALWSKSGSAADPIDHGAWDRLLATYVAPAEDGVNRVDYAAFKTDGHAALRDYLAAMQAVAIETYPRPEQFAYWVNLYNAATVDVILRNYPVDSIKDIGFLGQGPWKDKLLKVSSKELSLDDIEHGILRPLWKDVRIHYAVNCAALGCPNLADRAYAPDRLETMLEDAARAYVNHPRGFARIDGKLRASSIFTWYVDDWGSEAAVLDHAREYATAATLATLGDATEIDIDDYDWSLNDVA